MALCLEQYLDNLQALPGELQRKLLLLRELDKKAHAHLVEGDRLTSEFLTGGNKMTPADRKEWYKKIQDEFSQAKNIGDEKVQLAMQTYEMVDKHIRRLDNDLARFENELKRNILAPKSGDSNDSTASPSGGVAPDASAASATDKKMSKKSDTVAATDGKDKKKRKLEESAPKSSKKKRKDEIVATARQDGSTSLSKQKTVQQLAALSGVGFIQQFAGGSADVMDMPIDPNEPVYCICRQVSYGEMIGCDNPDCPIEWFHFNCVGLSSKPKGKWYCTRCTEEKKKHKTAS